jgi:hypothetical protein
MKTALPLIALLLVGCAETGGFHPTNPSPRILVPRAVDQVQVFSTGFPTRPFVEVGTLNSAEVTDFLGSPMEKLRQKAAQVGCDGVVVSGHMQSSERSSSSLGISSSSSASAVTGSCIVYTEPQQPPPPPSAPPPPPPPAQPQPPPIPQ